MNEPEGEWYIPNALLPDNFALARFKVATKHIQNLHKHRSEEQLIRFRGKLDASTSQEHATEILAAMKGEHEDTKPQDVQKTAKDIAEEHLKKDQVKLERKKQLGVKNSQPHIRCKKWVETFAMQMDLLKQAHLQVRQYLAAISEDPASAKISETILNEWDQTFKTHTDLLRKQRPKIESHQSKPSEALVAEGERLLNRMKQDRDAFHNLVAAYEPKSARKAQKVKA